MGAPRPLTLALLALLLTGCRISSAPTGMGLMFLLAPDGSATFALSASSVEAVDELEVVPGALAAMRLDPDVPVHGSPLVAGLRWWHENVEGHVPDMNGFRLDDLTCRYDAGATEARLTVYVPIGRHARWLARYPVYPPKLVAAMKAKVGTDPVMAHRSVVVRVPNGWKVVESTVTGLDSAHEAWLEHTVLEASSRSRVSLASALGHVDDAVLTWTIVYRRGED